MIPLFKVYMSQDAKRLVCNTLESGYIGQGVRVEEFEAELQSVLGLPRRPLATSSCTVALDLAYHLVGIGPGSEVVCTPMTCAATATQLLVRGAKIVWADIDPITGLIDPNDVKKRLTPKTKAIVCVDWAGRLCDYHELKSLGVPVIQDAAHSFGAHGIRGDYVCWSFQAIKHLTTADGGALLCPEDQVERADLLRWYGLDRKSGTSYRCKQDIPEAGYKYGMNDVAASVGLANIRNIQDILYPHMHNAESFGLRMSSNSSFVKPPPSHNSAWWLYTVLVDDDNAFIQYMENNGVSASKVHSRLDTKTCFAKSNRGDLPGVDGFSSREVCIPVGWWLSPPDIDVVVEVVDRWARK